MIFMNISTHSYKPWPNFEGCLLYHEIEGFFSCSYIFSKILSVPIKLWYFCKLGIYGMLFVEGGQKTKVYIFVAVNLSRFLKFQKRFSIPQVI